MKNFYLLIFFCCFWCDFQAQNNDSSKSSKILIDSTNNIYEYISYDDTSKLVEKMKRCHPDTGKYAGGYYQVDTTFGYHGSGVLAYFQDYGYKPWTMTGEFNVFDTLGNLIFEGSYWNNVRIGTWNYYSSQGKLQEETKYKF